MNDIINTANAFTSNFRNKGTFDYSIESLWLVDNFLEEMGNYECIILVVEMGIRL